MLSFTSHNNLYCAHTHTGNGHLCRCSVRSAMVFVRSPRHSASTIWIRQRWNLVFPHFWTGSRQSKRLAQIPAVQVTRSKRRNAYEASDQRYMQIAECEYACSAYADFSEMFDGNALNHSNGNICWFEFRCYVECWCDALEHWWKSCWWPLTLAEYISVSVTIRIAKIHMQRHSHADELAKNTQFNIIHTVCRAHKRNMWILNWP